MIDIEKVKKGLECCSNTGEGRCESSECPYWIDSICCIDEMQSDALALLKEQEALLHEYEKLSQVCFKIEKYLRIADLSILIDRIEEGKVEVLQSDGRPDAMETTIKIRRL